MPPACKIEYQMSYRQLDDLIGGDRALVDILLGRGMPVYFSDEIGNWIRPLEGNFYWRDQAGIRTFTWEGNRLLSSFPACYTCGCLMKPIEDGYESYRCVGCSSTRTVGLTEIDRSSMARQVAAVADASVQLAQSFAEQRAATLDLLSNGMISRNDARTNLQSFLGEPFVPNFDGVVNVPSFDEVFTPTKPPPTKSEKNYNDPPRRNITFSESDE